MTGSGRPLLIGEFARRCRLPVSTLRYYDRIGLLPPAVVDPTNGYRGYTADQLSSAVLISRLRGIGTAPRDIATALIGGEQAAAVLAAERRRVAGQVADGRRALAEIDDLLALHDNRPSPGVEVVGLALEQVAAAPFLADHTDLATAVLRAVAGLRGVLRRTGHERNGPWGATFPLQLAERVGGFVFARTSRPVDHPALDTAWLPATRVARTIHHGGPGTLAAAYAAALDMIDGEGWTPTGPVIEEYLAFDTSPVATGPIRLSVPIA